MRAALLALALAGCEGTALQQVPGSTLRYEPPVPVQGAEVTVDIFTDAGACRGARVSEEDLDRCLPSVDRASGEVRLAFQFKLDSENWPMRVDEDVLDVLFDDTRVRSAGSAFRLSIIPHDPVPTSQLFILVIDGSGSMNEQDDADSDQTRMDKVRKGLLNPKVVDRFFADSGSRVVLTTFTDGDPRPVGTSDFVLIDRPNQYKKLVKSLQPLGGYTHLYDAVDTATSRLLQQPVIKEYLALNDAQPTIVVLTDGFNNISSSDVCKDNAPRLSRLLGRIKEARGTRVEFKSRPTIFAVGLGRPLRKRSAVEAAYDPKNIEVSGSALCGRRASRRIDGDLEREAIDNASLSLMARHGGGFSYVRQDAAGLARAFGETAAERYRWFEVRYRVPQWYLRRSFKTTLRLTSLATGESSIRLHPSPWFDRPPGEPGSDGWVEPVPYRSSVALIMPVLGGLLALSFLGAALFNTRRALFNRPRRTRAKGRTAKGGETG